MTTRPSPHAPRNAAVKVLIPFFVAALVACDRRSGAPGREVRVAAAADLKFALDEISAVFRRGHPDVAVTITYGSSGSFYAQLSNDAPFDLFLSADAAYPQKLVEHGKGAKETLFRYASGRIVVWVLNESQLDVTTLELRSLADPSVRRVAIANPQHAPYGRAAEAAMRGARIYDQVKDRLVLGENVAQAAQFVQSGSADVGVIALSLALSPAMRDKGRYWEIPLDAYPRIEQGGVVLKSAKDPDAARALRAYLLAEEGKAILRKYGFSEAPG